MMNKYNGRRSHGWVPAPVCNTRVTKIFKYLHGEVANSEYEVRPAASLFAPDDTPDVRVDTIYNEARRALIRTYAHTRRRALDEEKAIRLRIPGWQPSPGEGPVAEWETEWLASGFFSSEGE